MYVQLHICQLASFCFMPKHEICHCSKAAKSKDGKSISRNACCCKLLPWEADFEMEIAVQVVCWGVILGTLLRSEGSRIGQRKISNCKLILQGVLELNWPLEWLPFGERQLDLCIPKSTSTPRRTAACRSHNLGKGASIGRGQCLERDSAMWHQQPMSPVTGGVRTVALTGHLGNSPQPTQQIFFQGAAY